MWIVHDELWSNSKQDERETKHIDSYCEQSEKVCHLTYHYVFL